MTGVAARAASVLRCACAALLWSCLAQAASTTDADEAEAQFRLGVRAFQQHDAQAAVAHFLASYRMAPNARVAYDLAIAYDAVGLQTEAFRYLSVLDSPSAPEALRSTAAALKQELERKVAVLEIRSEPAGAAVYVDRRDLGSRCTTPCVLALPEGTHAVFVERDGYETPASESRFFAKGSRTKLTPALKLIEGTLEFVGSHRDASLRLEEGTDALCTDLPCTASLPPGPHVIVARAPHHGEARIPVLVRPNARARVEVSLARLQGTLAVVSHPYGQVYVDGRAVGSSPLSMSVPAGDHSVEVRAPGYGSHAESVQIAGNDTTAVEVDLELREDVAGASRRIEEARVAPGSVTVITRSEIEAFGYPTLTEALRGVRGMFVSDDGFSQSADMRGFSSPAAYCSRILVLLDDKPLNNPYDGGACPGIQTLASIDDVERIEVIRGPSSALFGTSAFLATIQIITRTGSGKTKLGASVTAFGEGHGRVGVRAEVPAAGGNLYASVSAVEVTGKSEYFPELRASAGATDGGVDARGKGVDGWLPGGPSARATSVLLGFDSDAFHLRVFGHHYERTLSLAPYDVIINDPRSTTAETRFSFDGRHESTLGAGRLTVRAFGTVYNYDGHYAYPAPIGLEFEAFRGTNLGTEVRWEALLGPVRGSVGAEVRAQLRSRVQSGNEFEGTLLNTTDRGTFGGTFAQAVFDPVERVHVTLGTRFDYDPRVADASLWLFTSPRVAIVSERISGGTTKLLLGKAFRAATTIERIYVGSGWLANSPLEPEQILSAELEHRQAIANVSLLGTVFANRIQNLIVLAEVQPETFQFKNSPDVLTVAGVEAEVRWSLPRAMQLFAQASVSKQFQSGDEVHVGTNVPGWLAGMKFIAPLSVAGSSFALRTALEGGRRLPSPSLLGATTTDASVRLDTVLTVPIPGMPADAKLGIYNLFNAITSTVPAAAWRETTVPQEGRTLLLSLRIAAEH